MEIPAAQQVPDLGVVIYVHQGSTGGLEFPIVRESDLSHYIRRRRSSTTQASQQHHAGILVRAVVDSPLPPGSGVGSLLLIRAPDPPSRISDPPPFQLTIPTTCKEILRTTVYICSHSGHIYDRKNTLSYPNIPANCRRT